MFQNCIPNHVYVPYWLFLNCTVPKNNYFLLNVKTYQTHELINGKIIIQLHLISMFNCNQSCKTCTSYQLSCDNDDKEEHVDLVD